MAFQANFQSQIKDPKQKKLLIAGCAIFAIAGFIMYKTLFPSQAVSPAAVQPSSSPALNSGASGEKQSPAQESEINRVKLDTGILDVGAFKELTTYSKHIPIESDVLAGDIRICKPKTCVELGYECGNWSDGCSSIVSCGLCDKPLVCSRTGSCEVPACIDYPIVRSAISSTLIKEDDVFSITCDFGKANLDCIEAFSEAGGCALKGFSGTTAMFSCNATNNPGNYRNFCRLKSGTAANCCAYSTQVGRQDPFRVAARSMSGSATSSAASVPRP
jgi:hypothetical protein